MEIQDAIIEAVNNAAGSYTRQTDLLKAVAVQYNKSLRGVQRIASNLGNMNMCDYIPFVYEKKKKYTKEVIVDIIAEKLDLSPELADNLLSLRLSLLEKLNENL